MHLLSSSAPPHAAYRRRRRTAVNPIAPKAPNVVDAGSGTTLTLSISVNNRLTSLTSVDDVAFVSA